MISKSILEVVLALFDKAFLVADDVGMVDGCQYSDLVECVLSLALAETVEFDLLYCVDLVVDEALCLVYAGVCTFALIDA